MLNYHEKTTRLLGLLYQLLAIEEALVSGRPLMSQQGQAMDGISALANFRSVTRKIGDVLDVGFDDAPGSGETNRL